MSNAPASQAHPFGRGIRSAPTTEPRGRPGAGHGRRNLVLGLVAVSVAAVTVGGVQYARVSSQATVVAPASKLAEGVAAAEAYQEGGTVYTQQVPEEAVVAGEPAFVPGGSVYGQQVPSAP